MRGSLTGAARSADLTGYTQAADTQAAARTRTAIHAGDATFLNQSNSGSFE